MNLIPKLFGDPQQTWKSFTNLEGNLPLPAVSKPLSAEDYLRSVSSDAYNYPYYDYCTGWPQRCIEDPISNNVTCEDRNFVGPDYRNPYYQGKNFIDPLSKRCRKDRDFTPVQHEPLGPFSTTFPNSILGKSW